MIPLDYHWRQSLRNEGVICITFRNAPSKGGGTSSEAWTAWDQFPPGPHPILPAAIPSRRYPNIRNSDVSFLLPSESASQPEIRSAMSFSSLFRRINLAIPISGSTKSELLGWPVPPFGSVRLRIVGPLQKLGWPKSKSLPDFTLSSQRLSHLDVTQLSGTMRFFSHYIPKGSMR